MANIFRPFRWFRIGDVDHRTIGATSTDPSPRSDASDRSVPGSPNSTEEQFVSQSAPTENLLEESARAEAVRASDPTAGPIREKIEQRAYFNWRSDGCPEGQAMNYWLSAESEILEESHGSVVKRPSH